MRRTNFIPAARVLLTTAAVLVLGGCATKGDLRDLQTEIRSLAVRQDSLIAQLRVDALSTQDTLRETTDQLVDFRGDISRRLREISEALGQLEAMVGQNGRAISGVRDQLANIRRAPAGQPGGGTDVMTADPMSGGGVAGPQDAPSEGPVELYNAAIRQYNRGSVRTARIGFEDFLRRYPNDELAPAAHFYLADLLVQEDRLDEAEDAFGEIPELFPTSDWVADALYRIALIQVEEEREDDARATLERLLNSYPDDPDVSDLARDLLDELR